MMLDVTETKAVEDPDRDERILLKDFPSGSLL